MSTQKHELKSLLQFTRHTLRYICPSPTLTIVVAQGSAQQGSMSCAPRIESTDGSILANAYLHHNKADQSSRGDDSSQATRGLKGDHFLYGDTVAVSGVFELGTCNLGTAYVGRTLAGLRHRLSMLMV